jgi:membrane-bound serine protease (ClpP class)
LSTWLGAQETAPTAEARNGSPGTAILLTVAGAIGPATSDYLVRGIDRARDRGAELVVIEMDTPGGLDTSMREIIQAILDSPVPVATFVYPRGARAASAGTYILYASHVAAMAPATNLGAATPVSIGGAPSETPPPAGEDEAAETADTQEPDDESTVEEPATTPSDEAPEPGNALERKAINDAVAYIRSLAEHHDRNADWAEQAVRSAESLSAVQALEQGVVDLIAEDLDGLLEQLDGRSVEIGGDTVTLATEDLIRERIDPDWRTRLLEVISNPTVAYMLMLLGIYGLIFEGYNPGAIVPGVVGAIALLLALFSFQILPVNFAGLALILLGVILMISEFLVPSFGALGMGGIAAFVFGSLILIDTDVPGFARPTALIATIATTAALGMLALVWVAMRARQQPVVSGVEEMTGAAAEALEDFATEGVVWAHGERWNAQTSTPIKKGQPLRITKVEGLVLHVEPQ